jgi:AraC-like DNA-binding protein
MELPHPGILDPERFDEHFELHCYEPCDELKPFVTHIWTQRHRRTQAQDTRPPIELFSGPNIYLFFSPQAAVVRGVSALPFDYSPHLSQVVAGVKFRPGGFYAFWKKSMSELENATIPLVTVFPGADKNFTDTLLEQTDTEIVKTLEELLLAGHPVYDKKLDAINRVLKIVEENPLSQSVNDVARAFGRSERSLQLLFHHYVGVSLKWVIVRRRLLYTVNRVRSSRSSWTNTAAEAGYSNQSHFTREFKQATGISPSHYLKTTDQLAKKR